MGVLATGARRMLRRDPDAADEALATIEETGRTALREMRRLLDVLRTDAEPAGEPGAAAGPGRLDGAGRAGPRGRPAGRCCTGRRRPGGRSTRASALTVYRIVQEALTNALKHAGPRRPPRCGWRSAADWLTLEVYDTGRGPVGRATAAVGHGLLGMRERVALYGGTLRTGPRPGGGFRVYARIPLEQQRSTTATRETQMADRGRRPIRVLLVDDQPLLRTGFRMVLGAEPDLDIVGEAGDGAEAVDLARRLLPDVVLMDIRMPRHGRGGGDPGDRRRASCPCGC